MHVNFNILSHIAIFDMILLMVSRVFTRLHTCERDTRKIKRCRIVSTGMHPNREARRKPKKKEKGLPTHTHMRARARVARAHTRVRSRDSASVSISYAPLTPNARPIELPSEPSQKSSYLYSLLVG